MTYRAAIHDVPIVARVATSALALVVAGSLSCGLGAGCTVLATISGEDNEGTWEDADGDGWTVDEGDCDDSDAAVHPGADEYCDGADNDCNGTVDDDYALDAPDWPVDRDGDTHGDAEATQRACALPPGCATSAWDCDDDDDTVWPGAPELCDQKDNDCDGHVPTDETADGDGDLWVECEDCDDRDELTHPGAPEQCDGEDNDCDHVVPRNETTDADGDGFTDCADCAPDDPTTFPGAEEICGDGVVNDCDGSEAEAAEACGDAWGDIDLADADAKFIGEEAYDHVGMAVAAAGDVDSDGYDDLLVSGVDHGGGAVYLLLGSGSLTGAIDLSAADAKFTGDCSGCRVGRSIAGAGDVDGDGHPDLLLGAHWHSQNGSSSGAAYLVLGPFSGTTSLSGADARLFGSKGDLAGYSVSGIGDVDADGYADLLIGSLREDSGGSDAGAAYLVLGSSSPGGDGELSDADLVLFGESADDEAGVSVAGIGDCDGDGSPDLVVGAGIEDTGGTDAGAVYLVLDPGGLSGTISLSSADGKLTGEAGGDNAGHFVAGAGDTDGDGLQDFVVGAFQEDTAGTNAGAAYLVLGSISGTHDLSTADAKLIGEVAGDGTGRSVSSAGDVDGDGFGDLLVGSGSFHPEGTSRTGLVHVVLGPVSGVMSLEDAEGRLIGESAADNAGFCVAGAGDVDGDGFDDILLGADFEDAGGTDAGAAYLLYGGSTY